MIWREVSWVKVRTYAKFLRKKNYRLPFTPLSPFRSFHWYQAQVKIIPLNRSTKSDNGTRQGKAPWFHGTNYTNWKIRMSTFLQSLGSLVLDICLNENYVVLAARVGQDQIDQHETNIKAHNSCLLLFACLIAFSVLTLLMGFGLLLIVPWGVFSCQVLTLWDPLA